VECYVNRGILPALAGKMLGTVYPTGPPASLPKSARTSEILIQMVTVQPSEISTRITRNVRISRIIT
jgi:hypothetical protein